MSDYNNLLRVLAHAQCTPAQEPVTIKIDLETWGKYPGCAIRSIGACPWDMATGKRRDSYGHYYANVADQSNFEHGLLVDKETDEWWSRQSDAAQTLLQKNQVHLREALDGLRSYYQKVVLAVGYPPSVWGNGKEFDIAILDAAYRAIGEQSPWAFWNTGDDRTVVMIGRLLGIDFKRVLPFNGTQHYALDDADHQGLYTTMTTSMIKRVFDIGLATIKARAGTDGQ